MSLPHAPLLRHLFDFQPSSCVRGWRLNCVVAITLLCASALPACNVPVFRYALEKWAPENYDFYVLHRGPLSAADQAVIAALKKPIEEAAPIGNYNLYVSDLDKGTAEDVDAVLALLPEQPLPILMARTARDRTIWAGTLRADAALRILDSPKRRAIARSLLEGDSAVWVFLESGDQTKDCEAFIVLESELARLGRELKLPELTDHPDDQVAKDGPPLRLAFSLLCISRSDPAEEMFVKMLLNVESDLQDTKEPMVFPVFGRGRALYAIVGAGIAPRYIEQAAGYIVGRCTCTVKELPDNPGADLLMLTRWDELLTSRFVVEPDLPELSSLAALATPPSPPAPPEPSETSEESHLIRNVILALAGGLCLLLAATVFWMRRSVELT
jgi:hypothetical protein